LLDRADVLSLRWAGVAFKEQAVPTPLPSEHGLAGTTVFVSVSFFF